RMKTEKVLSYLARFNISRVAMESSNHGASLDRRLESKGYDVIVSHPRKTHYIAEAKIKSDRLDLQPVESYLRVLKPLLDHEIKLLSKQLREMADDEDEDMKLLMTIPGISYYSALQRFSIFRDHVLNVRYVL
ncbi:MAG: hypothetical protein ACLFU9_06645, partial [Candidatus Bathyarchaeia archaeon]